MAQISSNVKVCVMWLVFMLCISSTMGIINPKHLKAKAQTIASIPQRSEWKVSIAFDKMVGVHDMITRFNVTNTDLVYQMSRLAGSKLVPVVFICFNKVPRYLHHAIEMASRLNPVIVINDMFSSPAISSPCDSTDFHSPMPVFYVPLSYRKVGDVFDFEVLYQPINVNELPARQIYEKNCFLRWIILANLAATFNLPHVFYSDNDVLVAGNVTTALAVRRDAQRCDVVISAQGDQKSNLENWIGHMSGHSSFWSYDALQDWKDFLMSMYHHHKETLMLTGRTVSTSNGHNRVGDTSLLFLYFVAHHLGSAMWDAGRPQSFGTGRLRRTPKQMEEIWSKYDFKFKQARDSFTMARVSNPGLIVCNGLDVVDRATFDHQHATYSSSFSLNLNLTQHSLLHHFHHRHQPMNATSYQDRIVTVHDPLTHLLPHITGLTSFYGGRAESFDKNDVRDLNRKPLYFYALHYQGPGRIWLPLDVCQRLVSLPQYYMEHYYNPRTHISEIEKVFSYSVDTRERFLLDGIVDSMVLEDCKEILQNRAFLPPYPDPLND